MKIKTAIKRYIFESENITSFSLNLLYRSIKNQGLQATLSRRIAQAIGLYFWLGKRNKLHGYMLTPTNTVLFISDRVVIKHALSEGTMRDMTHALRMHNDLKSSALAALVPHRARAYRQLILIERLEPANPREYEISTIIDSFKTLGANQGETTLVALLNEIIPIFLPLNALRKVIPEKHMLRHGFMHGDLTPSNIMKRHGGQIALIDLDCSDFHGIPKYDQMHYEVEHEAKKHGRYNRYYNVLSDMIRNTEEQEKLLDYLFYFLYRLKMEKTSPKQLSSQERIKIEHIIDSFIIQHDVLNT